jgi:hypothetical protein
LCSVIAGKGVGLSLTWISLSWAETPAVSNIRLALKIRKKCIVIVKRGVEEKMMVDTILYNFVMEQLN